MCTEGAILATKLGITDCLLFISRICVEWVVSAWLYKRFLSVFAVSYQIASCWFNAYSITKVLSFSTNFVKRISGLGEDLVWFLSSYFSQHRPRRIGL